MLESSLFVFKNVGMWENTRNSTWTAVAVAEYLFGGGKRGCAVPRRLPELSSLPNPNSVSAAREGDCRLLPAPEVRSSRKCQSRTNGC